MAKRIIGVISGGKEAGLDGLDWDYSGWRSWGAQYDVVNILEVGVKGFIFFCLRFIMTYCGICGDCMVVC